MQFTHSDIEVSYNEKDNKWHFALRGRHRTADSPAQAKEFIDKEPSPAKAKKFPRFTAYLRANTYGHSANVQEVEVTNIAERSSYKSFIEFWIYNPANKNYRDSGREKAEHSRLITKSAGNDELLNEIRAIEGQIAQLDEQATGLAGKLEFISIPEGFE